MRRAHGHPVMGAIAGFFFGVSLSLLLATFGHVALNSNIFGILPIVFLILGIVWGLWAPLGRRKAPSAFAPAPATATATAAPAPAAAAPAATEEPAPVEASGAVVPDSLAAPPLAEDAPAPEGSGEGADESSGSAGAV